MTSATTADDLPCSSPDAHLPWLTTGNFSTWLRRFTVYVSANGRGAVLRGEPLPVQGALESPEDYEAKLAKREADDCWVLNAIYATVDDSNAAFVDSASSAKEAIELLRTLHGADRTQTACNLFRELVNTKLSSGGDVRAHITRMRQIQNGLVEHATRASHASAKGNDEDTVDFSFSDPAFAVILLLSLPSPDFDTLRESIYSDPVSKLKSMVVYRELFLQLPPRI
ncbi:hypothetical protein JCM1840_005574 [Sporobolomyces johnsonii]